MTRLLLLILVGLSGVAGADSKLDSLVRSRMNVDNVPGLALGVVVDGKVVYERGYGYENREKRIRVSPKQTRFRWASISKTLAGTVAAMADSRGYLDLDADIRDYYPQYQLPSTHYSAGVEKSLASHYRITLRRLLSHTAGMQHYTNGKTLPIPPFAYSNSQSVNTGMEWALSYWVTNPLVSLPGYEFNYSTPGFNLAGVVIGKALGSSFEGLVKNWIGITAGMFSLRADTLWNPAPRRAHGYIATAAGLILDGDNDVSWKLAGGGFLSTSRDMNRYAAALMGGKLLTAAEKTVIWTRSKLSGGAKVGYGLGWEVGSKGGRKRVRHSGAQQKARSLLTLYPAEEFAITLLTNAGHSVNLSSLASQIESVIRGRWAQGQSPIQP